MQRMGAHIFLAASLVLGFSVFGAAGQTAGPDTLTVAVPDTVAVKVPADSLPPVQDTLAVPDSPAVEEAPLSLADQVIAYARTFTGTPYRLGAAGPKEFDCSSFTHYVFRHFGYTITAFSQAQFREGRPVERYGDLQKGDLVFFGKRAGVRTIGHVGIIVSINEEQGSFTFIHASVSKGVTEETSNHPYFMMRYVGARRILPDE